MSHPPPGSILEGIALTPQQSFPEMGPITAGTPVTIYTGGHAHIWKVSHTWPVSGTSVNLKHKNCVITVDKNWLTFDTKVGTLVLQRLGFFNDSILKCTTSFPAQNGECFENVRDKSHSLDDREHGCPILSQPEGTGCASQRRAIYRCDFPRIAAGKTIFLHLGPPQRSPHRR